MDNGLKVSVDIFPFRASIKNKDVWELKLDIENTQTVPAKMTIEMDLPRQVTFSKVGLVNRYEKRFESFKAGTHLTLKEPVFLSSQASAGNFSGHLRIAQHLNEFGYETKVHKKEILFRIVP